ncbi:nuclear transport factor 2 family protein [Grimontia marina]|uniref:nuclear transport factor 2 family protein n=1 Tax=Grimontia marina TaxID=646534 RepID=UPI0018DC1FBD|nr:nuclear transport factor 2 family protein [Grimontia marina]
MKRSFNVNNPTTQAKPDSITTDFLDAFSKAWNDHDVEALMTFMTDDCVFLTAAGSELQGTTISGFDAVRDAFEQVWKTFPDVCWKDAEHTILSGSKAITESTFCATKPDGSRIEARMVDVFTLRDGKIAVKNAFRKDRPALVV